MEIRVASGGALRSLVLRRCGIAGGWSRLSWRRRRRFFLRRLYVAGGREQDSGVGRVNLVSLYSTIAVVLSAVEAATEGDCGPVASPEDPTPPVGGVDDFVERSRDVSGVWTGFEGFVLEVEFGIGFGRV